VSRRAYHDCLKESVLDGKKGRGRVDRTELRYRREKAPFRRNEGKKWMQGKKIEGGAAGFHDCDRGRGKGIRGTKRARDPSTAKTRRARQGSGGKFGELRRTRKNLPMMEAKEKLGGMVGAKLSSIMGKK